MTPKPSPLPPLEPPLARLEQAFIEEFVRSRGHDPGELDRLPAEQRAALLKDASVYASAKLSEVEARSHFVHAIHDEHVAGGG